MEGDHRKEGELQIHRTIAIVRLISNGKMIGLITYDRPHLKTQEIAERCKNKVSALLLVPFKERPRREVAFHHRPYQFEGPSPKELAKSVGAEILYLSDLEKELASKDDYLVVGGAGILDAEYTSRYRIINAHPGLIPSSRGLDAFKWAIYNKVPLGVTLHHIDNEVDMGRVLHHELTNAIQNTRIFMTQPLLI